MTNIKSLLVFAFASSSLLASSSAQANSLDECLQQANDKYTEQMASCQHRNPWNVWQDRIDSEWCEYAAGQELQSNTEWCQRDYSSQTSSLSLSEFTQRREDAA
ncbi:hypothetical protein [Sphingomonas parapaucimobilis]|uniref:hypothetical protein n=1 Tax=Sphingomonas parapaucimobilis TaxID=28213 RepID=UPI0035C83AAE